MFLRKCFILILWPKKINWHPFFRFEMEMFLTHLPCWMHVWPGGGTGPSSQLCVVFSSASSSRGKSSFVFLGSPCFIGLLNNVSKLNFPGSSRFTSSARSRLFPCGLTDASRGSWAHLSNGTHNHSLTQKDTQKMLSSESKFTQ